MLERFEGMDVQTVSDEIAAPGFEQAIRDSDTNVDGSDAHVRVQVLTNARSPS
jgi:hypothetical protein